MVSWVWIPVSAIIGGVFAVLVIALCMIDSED